MILCCRTNKRVETLSMEETEKRTRQHSPNKHTLTTVLLHITQKTLAKSRKVRVSILRKRLIHVPNHSSQVVHVLHGDHISPINNKHFDRGEVIPALSLLDLLQRQRGGDDKVAVVKVGVKPEGSVSIRDAYTETIFRLVQ